MMGEAGQGLGYWDEKLRVKGEWEGVFVRALWRTERV